MTWWHIHLIWFYYHSKAKSLSFILRRILFIACLILPSASWGLSSLSSVLQPKKLAQFYSIIRDHMQGKQTKSRVTMVSRDDRLIQVWNYLRNHHLVWVFEVLSINGEYVMSHTFPSHIDCTGSHHMRDVPSSCVCSFACSCILQV